MGKYWDIIPPERIKRTKPRQADLADLIKNFKKFTDQVDLIPRKYDQSDACLHRQCPSCGGTGYNAVGRCIHMLSCPCSSCSPRLEVVGSVTYDR